MKYIVLDLEFNQAFDFGNGDSQTPDERCPFEIIQIGAVRLNSSFKHEASLNLLIEPVIYKKLHPYVRRITGLSNASLRNKQSFEEAFSKLIEFTGKKRAIYCVWGANDIKELRKNIEYYNLSNGSSDIDFIDVQNIASKYLNRVSGMCVGLKNAVNALDIEIDKPFHNALNDAEYTAKILQRLKREPWSIMQYTHDNIIKTAPQPSKIDFVTLYNAIESKIGRALTTSERWIFKNAYLGGKAKRVDKNN